MRISKSGTLRTAFLAAAAVAGLCLAACGGREMTAAEYNKENSRRFVFKNAIVTGTVSNIRRTSWVKMGRKDWLHAFTLTDESGKMDVVYDRADDWAKDLSEGDRVRVGGGPLDSQNSSDSARFYARVGEILR